MMTTANPSKAFCPKRALILTKFSRYEFEKRRFPDVTEEELINNLKKRGSDYKGLLYHHTVHTENRENVVKALKENGVEVKVVNRFEYTKEKVNWADVVITTGGDGTFLMAAAKIISRDKPLIGINSDPTRSVGYLCLPPRYTTNFEEALDRFKRGDFTWKHRQRIKITLQSENAFEEPVELHNQQLSHPEYRYLDLELTDDERHASLSQENEYKKHELPIRALNEVFVGESLSSRVSYYEFSPDGQERVKLKSSGLTVCTGTGSTSWSLNINKLTHQTVRSILSIVQQETGVNVPQSDDVVERVTRQFNNSLTFDPDVPKLAYTIRDPVFSTFDRYINPRGLSKKVEVRSRMTDACIVIDGGLSYKFNDGSTAIFEVDEDDGVKTVLLE